MGSRRLAMKLVVALALPAAALRPVKVTMSAAQNRRAFVIGGTAAAVAAATKANAYSLPDLPYAYDALEPSIDAATMKFHHDMFWQAMAPKGKGGAPSAALSAAIDKS